MSGPDRIARRGTGNRNDMTVDRPRSRVTIVEDEGIVAMYLQSLLSSWGYEVVATLSSGEEAVASAVADPPDLMLMDVQLRGDMDGIDAAAGIRATHDLPFVFLTAFCDAATLERVGASDAYSFVRKPFDERDLQIAVEMALFRQRAGEALKKLTPGGEDPSGDVDGVIAIDEFGRVRYMNAAAERLTGSAPATSFGLELSEVVRPMPTDSGPSVSDVLRSVLGGDGGVSTGRRCTIARPNGTASTLELRAAAIVTADGGPAGTVVLLHDASERPPDEKQQVRLARHAPQTGPATRDLFEERLAQALDLGRRDDRCVGVILVHLDRFNEVNESHGREAADGLLAAASDRILGRLRRSDTIATIGGNEIAIALADLDSAAGAHRAADKLVAAFDSSFEIRGTRLATGISVGVSVFPRDGENPAELIEGASAALTRAGQTGRGRVGVHGGRFDDSSEPRNVLDRDLRKALDRGDLEVHYQPIFALSSRHLAGAEALIRWRHPEHGLISATDFLGTARHSGLISPITDRVLEIACRQVTGWHAHSSPLAVAVNLNDSQLQRRDLVATVESALAASRLDPARLQLEVAERTVVDHPSQATVDTIDALRGLGARITLDGFGSSHGAMVSLRRLSLDLLKIDRSLVSGLPGDRSACAIVEAAFASARQLGIAAAATGVEAETQLRWLVDHGCQIAQGFLLGPAVPAAKFEAEYLVR